MRRPAGVFVVLLLAAVASAAPRRMGDGVFSTSADEFGGAITPDGNTIYFNRSVPRSYLYVICVSHQHNGQWSRPEIAPFSGHYRDSDPLLSPDGHRLYFVSDRPWPGQKDPNFDVWVVDLDGPYPDAPRHMPGAVNSDQNEYFASEADDGTIYVASERTGSIGGADIYRVKRVDGEYPVAENLGEQVNRKGAASLDALIAPDQSFLILGSFGRSAPGDSDLFVTRNKGGVWSAPEPLAAVNTEAREYSPRFSPDGKELIFASERGIPTERHGLTVTYRTLLSGAEGINSGLGNIYRIPLRDLGLPDLTIRGAAARRMNEAAQSANPEKPADRSGERSANGPRLFAPNVVSTAPLAELSSAFSPDGREVYFVVRTPTTTSLPLSAICVSRRVGGKWQRPAVASFSGREFDAGPAMSPDGKRLFFSSNRAMNGTARADADLWYVDRTTGGGWSEPHNLGAPVNSASSEISPSVAADGTLYFASDRAGGRGSYDLYRSRLVGGRYQEPENLGAEINSEAAELTPFITPDQRLLLFSAIGRPDMKLGGGNPYARSDLYASEWKAGAWTPPRRLPEPVNSMAADSYPVLSRDRKTLYFSSERSPFVVPVRSMTFETFDAAWHQIRNGLSNIYSVPASEAGLPVNGASSP